MRTKMNFSRIRRLNNTPVSLRKARGSMIYQKNSPRTYREGQFWIGEKSIQKYRPDRNEKVSHGIFFNASTGRFEFWQSGKIKSSMNWKVGQAALFSWVKQCGADSFL